MMLAGVKVTASPRAAVSSEENARTLMIIILSSNSTKATTQYPLEINQIIQVF